MKHEPPLIPFRFCLALPAPVRSLNASVPMPGSPVMVLHFPWVDREAEVRAARGQVMGPVSASFALVAFGEDPAFAGGLTRAGAFGVRDASLLFDLCGVEP